MRTYVRHEISPARRVSTLGTDRTFADQLTVVPPNLANVIEIKRTAGVVESFKNDAARVSM
ncbi:MAG: hypothetical protein R3C05_24130 [Pirellulaceae bacterium]